ncbi:F-box protein SKIP14-like [Tasmannia lanceolata]|uniref:F-box protein SKIP14-like n=1 Tax=Tasmannia lanceolata TaxID=3420 RepID=UPI004062BA0D
MALNIPTRATLPMNPSEDDNLVSSIQLGNSLVMEGVGDKSGGEKNGEGFESFDKPRPLNWEVGESYDLGKDKNDSGCSCDPITNDVLNLLPSDPFGMEMSATVTTITGWLEGLEMGSEDSGSSGEKPTKGDYQLVAVWNRAMVFESQPHNVGDNERLSSPGWFDGWAEEKELDDGFISISNLEGFMSFVDKDEQVINCQSKVSGECSYSCSDGDGGAPHEALSFALPYLGVRDLLSVERVCKSLHLEVQNDVLLWRHIHIDHPLSERLTDTALLQLTSRARGTLQCLSLVNCLRISDDGLKRVLQCNPRLTKLSVPGCLRLSTGSIVDSLKALKSQVTPGTNKKKVMSGIKCLRFGGLYGISREHFEELRLLLDADKWQQPKARKPHYYHLPLSCDDECVIDIEMCPRCQNVRLVYDCPVEGCQGKQPVAQQCRACIFCIPRCVQCGRCINDNEYEETFCLDLLCLGCWKLMSCSKHTIFHQETRYHFCLYC